MSRARTEDMAQANRMRWFLAAHLLAVLLIFEASLWVGQHLAARPEAVPKPLSAAQPLSRPERLAAAATSEKDDQ